MVLDKRKEIGQRTGGLKLYDLLKDTMQQQGIKMGRDKFYHFLRSHNLLVARTKKHHITTYSKHRFFKYKNLIKDKAPTRPEQLWVSDITYIKTEKGHAYLALVTDAYSRQIMGYKLASHMKTSLCIDALKMALKNRKFKTTYRPNIWEENRCTISTDFGRNRSGQNSWICRKTRERKKTTRRTVFLCESPFYQEQLFAQSHK